MHHAFKQIGKPMPGNFPVFSPDGKILAVGDPNTYQTTLWDATSQEQINTEQLPGNRPYFNQDGTILAVANVNSYKVTLWNASTQTKIGGEIPGYYVSFSPDGKILAIGDRNSYTTTVWDVRSQKQIGTQIPGSFPIFNPDGSELADGNASDIDYTTTLWDVDTANQTVTPKSSTLKSNITSLKFSADGKVLATKAYEIRRNEQASGKFLGPTPEFAGYSEKPEAKRRFGRIFFRGNAKECFTTQYIQDAVRV